MKACRCHFCGDVFPMESLIRIEPDPEHLATLEDDEPEECMCPSCLNVDVPAVWNWFYKPGEPKPIEVPEIAAAKVVQGELF